MDGLFRTSRSPLPPVSLPHFSSLCRSPHFPSLCFHHPLPLTLIYSPSLFPPLSPSLKKAPWICAFILSPLKRLGWARPLSPPPLPHPLLSHCQVSSLTHAITTRALGGKVHGVRHVDAGKQRGRRHLPVWKEQLSKAAAHAVAGVVLFKAGDSGPLNGMEWNGIKGRLLCWNERPCSG